MTKQQHIVVINHKTTKFESNSQLRQLAECPTKCCYQSQNYKIWKQFTTKTICKVFFLVMLSITKLQNLKAIHNLQALATLPLTVVINHKTTKFESNSQLLNFAPELSNSCYQSQNYKIWKQFTTSHTLRIYGLTLLSITKLQNLKAIHNAILLHQPKHPVVINHKTTKFESNSQRLISVSSKVCSCYQSQNYKIRKEFTINKYNASVINALLSIAKLQNLKAIHNIQAT